MLTRVRYFFATLRQLVTGWPFEGRKFGLMMLIFEAADKIGTTKSKSMNEEEGYKSVGRIVDFDGRTLEEWVLRVLNAVHAHYKLRTLRESLSVDMRVGVHITEKEGLVGEIMVKD